MASHLKITTASNDAGGNDNGQNGAAAFFGTEIMTQAVVNVAVKLDPEVGNERAAKLQTMKNVEDWRVIGSRIFQPYSTTFNIYKGDPLVVLRDDTSLVGEQTGAYFDSRQKVCSALNGLIVPDGVTNEFEWRKWVRVIGVAAFNYYTAAPLDQVQYGETVVMSGAIGGPTHRAPETFYPGDYGFWDKIPLDEARRQEWMRQFYYDSDVHKPGIIKPVLRKWDPYDARQLVDSAMSTFWLSSAFVERSFSDIDGASGFVNRADYIALLKGKEILWNALAGALVLQQFGLCTLRAPEDAPKTTQWNSSVTATDFVRDIASKKFTANFTTADLTDADKTSRDTTLTFIAKKLGLIDELGKTSFQPALVTKIIGTAIQPTIMSQKLAEHFDAANFFHGDKSQRDGLPQQLRRVQRDAYEGEISAFVDVFHQHASEIGAKFTKISTVGEPSDFIVMA